MKITSLFKDKAYAFTSAGNPEDDCDFAKKVLHRINPTFEPKDIRLHTVKDHCDIFLITDNKDLLKLKVSLDDEDSLLKKEATALRSISSCKTSPKLISQGSAKIGDDLQYLLTKIPIGENVRDYGRSGLFEKVDLFFASYWDFFNTRPVKQTYKKILERFSKNLIPEQILPQESLEAVKTYTDYNLCKKIFSDLRNDLDHNFEKVKKELKYKCHANLSLDSIFVTSDSFYFDELHSVCMGHPYIDLIDVMLEVGLPQVQEMSFFKEFCVKGKFNQDIDLYNKLYDLQTKKKLTELLTAYVKEVYLYDSYRYEKILFIADTFAHCFEKFAKIRVFKENSDFIMKTICEPIFGVKP